jgi:hypothetical protein
LRECNGRLLLLGRNNPTLVAVALELWTRALDLLNA